MKYFGSILEFTHDRNKDLLRAFHQQLLEVRHIYMPDIFRRVVAMPSARFWVSEERATVVISAMLQGKHISGMRGSKQEMFEEIYRRVLVIRQQQPKRTLPDTVAEVIHQPAPKFYMTPGTARVVIYRIKRGFYDQQKP
jgi:hypothetical protein